MALPELIEIVPLDKPVRAEITVPGSKSITNRSLILAALADGEVILEGALWSEDTQVMVEALQKLGFQIKVKPDPNEMCNRTITVYGQGGKVSGGGTAENPLELFVGNAGTAARFLTALVCLGKGVYRLHGVPRMHERPQAALFNALRELGYRVDSENDKLPATIFGGVGAERGSPEPQHSRNAGAAAAGTAALRPRRSCTVSIEESSQFASALLLCAKIGNWKIEVVGENAEESPYVVMTTKMIEAFPKNGGVFEIDSDASSASYFWGARFLLNGTTEPINYRITTPSWSQPELQIDTEFPGKLLLRDISRLHDLGDSIMMAITLAPTNQEISRFSDLKRLRLQETERVVALRTELTKCGAKVVEEGDTLTVYPSKLHGAEIETYNDHRMAMCFAILGLKVPGIKIKNPACVKKTFPNFFQKLAAPPPNGLGATILDAKTGRRLEMKELFAD
jgi:3-phosphoshikimate 1-carboxyvinyltransferase